MRKAYGLLFCLFIPAAAYAQKVEFGGGGGPTFYKGDLQPRFRPLNPGAAGNLVLRYNFNRVVSAKAQVMYGLVKGDDRRSGDPFQRERDFSFRNTVLDYGVQIEYNFLNFRTHDGRYEYDWTPYLFGGYGKSKNMKRVYTRGANRAVRTNQRGGNDIIPFGIGIKKILTPRLNLSAEFSTRVFLNKRNGSMFDGLDGERAQNAFSTLELFTDQDPNYHFYFEPNTRQNDKYFHLSVTVSYLIYRVHCDTPGKKFQLF